RKLAQNRILRGVHDIRRDAAVPLRELAVDIEFEVLVHGCSFRWLVWWSEKLREGVFLSSGICLIAFSRRPQLRSNAAILIRPFRLGAEPVGSVPRPMRIVQECARNGHEIRLAFGNDALGL